MMSWMWWNSVSYPDNPVPSCGNGEDTTNDTIMSKRDYQNGKVVRQQDDETCNEEDENEEVYSANMCYSKRESISAMEKRIYELHDLLLGQASRRLSDNDMGCISPSSSCDEEAEDDDEDQSTTSLTSLSSSSRRRQRRVVTVVHPHPTDDCRYYFYSSFHSERGRNDDDVPPSIAGSSVSTISTSESSSTTTTSSIRSGGGTFPLPPPPPPPEAVLSPLLPRTRTYIQIAAPYSHNRISNQNNNNNNTTTHPPPPPQRDNGWGYFVDAKEEIPQSKTKDSNYRSFLQKELCTAPNNSATKQQRRIIFGGGK